MSETQLTEFLRFMSSSVLKVAGGEAEDLLARGAQASMISNALLGGVVKVPFQFLALPLTRKC